MCITYISTASIVISTRILITSGRIRASDRIDYLLSEAASSCRPSPTWDLFQLHSPLLRQVVLLLRSPGLGGGSFRLSSQTFLKPLGSPKSSEKPLPFNLPDLLKTSRTSLNLRKTFSD